MRTIPLAPPRFATLSRRRFLSVGAAATGIAIGGVAADGAAPRARTVDLRRKVEGLLVGTLLGDALGGPVEFQPPEAVHALPDGPKAWPPGERLDAAALEAARGRFRLRGYQPLRPVPEPYGHWATDAPPGTLTDDSRHKMVLAHALRTARSQGRTTLGVRPFAEAYLTWGDRPGARPEHREINDEWMREVGYAARWVLGERDNAVARPPERLWNGLPTCMGQMALLPLAAAYPGDPEGAFLAAYNLAFFDPGWGKDLNAGLVAALAVALTLPAELDSRHASWEAIRRTFREVDPYRQADVPWCERQGLRWLREADRMVEEAAGEPARLFAAMDAEFAEASKWEAQVPFVAAFATARLADYLPLETMQVCLEWGHDTDSYAQVLGAMFGALHGPEVFPDDARSLVAQRLEADYGESLDEWIDLFSAPLAVSAG